MTQILNSARSRPLVSASLLFLFVTIVCAFFAPLLSPQNPYDLAALNLLDSRLRPGETGISGSVFWLGADGQGRDITSAILYGVRISIVVGLISSSCAMVFGSAVGLISGYFGGKVDALTMRLVDIQLSMPAILVAMILLALLGRGVENIIIALVTVQWVYFARTARSSALVERKKEYVQSCQVLGYGPLRILIRHILPNILGPLTVVATVECAVAISLEATLSFLGLGMPITEPSLGLLIANGFAYLLNGEYWISIYPGIALLLLVFSINIVGDHIGNIADPRVVGPRALPGELARGV